jgi:hypothetical protein
MRSRTRFATPGSLESIATADRSLAEQAEMPIDEVVELAVADKLWVAARRAHERRSRSQTIKRLMYLKSIQEPGSTHRGTCP